MSLNVLRGSKNQTAVLVAIGLAVSFALMGVWVRMMEDSNDLSGNK